MKRVRYLVGAAGLAPAAIGMAMPAAAHAAAAGPAAGQAKTVSLHYAGTATPDAGCTGTTEFTVPQNGNLRGHGWYTNGTTMESGRIVRDVCVGTVVAQMYFTKSICKTVSIDVSGIPPSGTGVGFYSHHQYICGFKDKWYTDSWGVHKLFISPPAQMCVFSTYHNVGDCKNV